MANVSVDGVPDEPYTPYAPTSNTGGGGDSGGAPSNQGEQGFNWNQTVGGAASAAQSLVPSHSQPQTFRIQPFDPAKLAGKRDPKYDFLRIAQRYDPRLGVTQGLINELNQLGYANFYGSGQHIGYRDVTDLGRSFDLNPGGFEGDFIQNWGNGQNPNAQWAWDWYEPPTTEGNSTPLPMPSFNPWLMQQMAYQPPQQTQAQNPTSDPAFWQSIFGPIQQMLAPRPGYSAMQAPSFAGAQSGQRGQLPDNSAQMMQMISQLIAGLMGAR